VRVLGCLHGVVRVLIGRQGKRRTIGNNRPLSV